MVKRSSEEPADKASERLRQWEDARAPVPDNEGEKNKPDKPKEDKAKPKKSKQKTTNKNK